MDWELVTQQILRQVEDYLPGPLLAADSSTGVPSGAEPPAAAEGGRPRTSESRLLKEFERDDWCTSVQKQVAASCSAALEGEVASPAHQACDSAHYVLGSSDPDALGSKRLDVMVDSLQQQQVMVNHAMRVQKLEFEQGLTEVRVALRRMELVERRISEQGEDYGKLSIAASRAEGLRAALQGRQEQLDAEGRDIRHEVAALDKRCMLTETALHGAMSHGQVIDIVRSIFGPFRAQVDERIRYLETENSELKDCLGHTSTRTVSKEVEASMERALAAESERSQATTNQVLTELKVITEAALDTERRRQDILLGALKEQIDNLSREARESECDRHRTGAKIEALESTIGSLGKRLAAVGEEETARIRKELWDIEAGLQRRIEEVRAFDIRKTEEVSGELERERGVRLRERKEVAQEVSNVRGMLLKAEQRHGAIHERLGRLEASMVSTVDSSSQTSSSVVSMAAKLRGLQLEIQDTRDALAHVVEQFTIGNRRVPGTLAVANLTPTASRTPPGAQAMQSVLQPAVRESLPQPNHIPPSTMVEGSRRSSLGGTYYPELVRTVAKQMPMVLTDIQGGECSSGGAVSSLCFGDSPAAGAEDAEGSMPPWSPDRKAHAGMETAQPRIDLHDEGRDVDSSVHDRGSKTLAARKDDTASKRVDEISCGIIGQSTCSSECPKPEARNTDGTGQDGHLLRASSNLELGGHGRLPEPSPTGEAPPTPLSLPWPTPVLARRTATESVKGGQSENECVTAPPGGPGELHTPSPFCSPPSPPSPPGNANAGHTSAAIPADITTSTSNLATSHSGVAEGANTDEAAEPKIYDSAISPKQSAGSNDLNSDGSCTSCTSDEGDEEAAALNSHESRQPVKGESNESVLARKPSLGMSKPSTARHVQNTTRNNPSSNQDGGGISNSTSNPNRTGTTDGRTIQRPRAPPPPKPTPSDTAMAVSKNSEEGRDAGPASISLRERSGSKDAGVATAQCEFCLRRYLRTAMNSHLQTCELRLVRCPFQCGVKMLVRNVDKHKRTCSLRDSADNKRNLGSQSMPTSSRSFHSYPGYTTAASVTTSASHAPLASEPAHKRDNDGRGPTEKHGTPAVELGEADRTVTCMRCHESLPFLLVPSHGPKCKGNSRSDAARATPSGPALQGVAPRSSGLSLDTAANKASPSTRAQNEAMEGEKKAISAGSQATSVGKALNSPHTPVGLCKPDGLAMRSSGGLSPAAVAPQAWHTINTASRIGTDVLTAGVNVPRSPPRSRNVRLWGTRQVTSWLRENMRPPRAEIISRFHEGGIDGIALLKLTDRDLLHPTEGMGIVDADVRRQILEAVDALSD